MAFEAFNKMGMNRAWYDYLKEYLESKDFQDVWIKHTQKVNRYGGNLYPTNDTLFAAFEYSCPEKIKVVMFGGSPRYGKFATGVAFESTNDSQMIKGDLMLDIDKYSPELINQIDKYKYEEYFKYSSRLRVIRKVLEDTSQSKEQSLEAEKCYDATYSKYLKAKKDSGRDDLDPTSRRLAHNWLVQGVLMLNINFTESCNGQGFVSIWEPFLKHVLGKLSREFEKISWINSDPNWAYRARNLIENQSKHNIVFQFDINNAPYKVNEYIRLNRHPNDMIDWVV